MATFLLLFSIIIAAMEVRACTAAVVEGYYPMATSCSTSDNYTSESQYKQNLRQLLSVLPTEVITGGGFHQETAGAPPDEVFGIMMCYADRKLDECQYCLAASTTLVTQVCPNSRRVSASYDACLLRYADAPFPPVADTAVAFHATHSVDSTVDAAAMAGARARLMVRLGSAAAASPARVANGSAPYNSSQEVFGLAQCSRDLNASECSRCVASYIEQLPRLFPGYQTGGDVKGYSCLLRFETAPFDVALPPPSAAPAPGTSSPAAKSSNGGKSRSVAIVVSAGSVAVLVLLGLSIWFLMGRSRRGVERGTRSCELEEEDLCVDDEAMGDEFENGTGGARRFRHSELVVATDNFSDDRMLGQGGFGSVYRGYYKEMNLQMAVKRVSKDSKQGKKEYASEVRIISRLRHRNLVQLIGWCHGGGELLLAYELMPNGSLDGHLYSADTVLSWPARYNIVLGIASAVLYLHQEWEQCVLHRDIKPSNIMLDASFSAKLGDFGLARLVDHGQGSHTTILAGTMGYMDPECIVTGRASTESDIYSLGVVLLEIACGRKPVVILQDHDGAVMHLARHVSELHDKGMILDAADPRLDGEYDLGEMKAMLLVGLWCTHHSRSQRPSIRQAVNALRFEAPLPTLPSGMPVATYMPPIGRLDCAPSSILGGRS